MQLPENTSFTVTPVLNGIRFITVHDHETRQTNSCIAVPALSIEAMKEELVKWVRAYRRDLAALPVA